jgi:hypothetical protein
MAAGRRSESHRASAASSIYQVGVYQVGVYQVGVYQVGVYQVGGVTTQIDVQASSPLYQCGINEE